MSSSNHLSGPLRVLIVDDFPATSCSLAMVLKHFGFIARAVQNGQEALEAVQTDWPDVVFLDLAMPGMDGYEVANRIRALAGAKRCPRMAAITGNDRPEHRMRSLAEGMDEHFVKPTDPDTLIAWLWRVAGETGRHG
jgi:CheY-like chemotaxis protein